jgi:hypothetical protein
MGGVVIVSAKVNKPGRKHRLEWRHTASGSEGCTGLQWSGLDYPIKRSCWLLVNWCTDLRDQCWQYSVRRRQGVSMEQTVRVFDHHYFAQTTADLLKLRAEVQKLRVAIQLAEASMRRISLRARRRDGLNSFAPSAENQLHT